MARRNTGAVGNGLAGSWLAGNGLAGGRLAGGRLAGGKLADSRAALAVLLMAAGVLAVSIAYAAGRANAGAGGTAHAAAVAAYWLGEALIFGPPAALALGRPQPGEQAAAWLAVALGTATYLVKYLYSPSFFEFPDELEHWRTLVTVLTTHHLFGANYALPISPDYPGIEVVTSALISLTGLGVFAAGLIVAGLAHLVFTTALYKLFRQVGGTPQIGLAAVTCYATNPHYQVFDAIFGYQTLALAFFALALLALRTATQPVQPGVGRTRVIGTWVLAAVFAVATAATHHVTSYMLAGTALLVAATTTVTTATTRRRAAIAAPAGFAVGCGAIVALWTWRVAPATVSYLSPAVSSLADSVRSALAGHIPKSPGTAALPAPLADRAASYAVALLIMAGIPLGWRRIWRTKRADPWALALGAGAALYYPCVALPFIIADGSELAGRMLTFVYIPVGYTLAVTLVSWPQTPRAKAAKAAVVAILLAGGIAMGWPPWWERLPGGYVVDAFDSGITTESVAAATWAAATLAPGQRVAADYTNNLLMGTYGGLNPVNDVAALFCGGQWTAADAVLARQQAIKYLVVDLRTSVYRNPDGSDFIDSTTACPTPVPLPDLRKFDSVAGMTRVYDSGNIVVYALSEAAYAP